MLRIAVKRLCERESKKFYEDFEEVNRLVKENIRIQTRKSKEE